jgi:7-keto-8-aminopelargonate synthetase-like enzyme
MSTKIIHSNINDIIDEIFTDATNKGVLHLQSEDKQINGKTFQIKGQTLNNFGSCGYLGLEMDPRLIEGAINALHRYGTQFSLSRSYITNDINLELEELVSTIYGGASVMVTPSTTAAHLSTIPFIIKERDLVILDQQVHFSVQNAVQLLRPKGTKVEMIRHSSLSMLEEKIKSLENQHDKIWYMIDGVYSMFGDFPPIHELVKLMDKYEKLHLYIDDAHGMSWAGKNGSGYIMSQIPIHPKIILVGTLAKGFGINGGVVVFPNKELCRKVKIFGGPQSYSHPLAPATLGAGIASAKIHLSDEIYELQKDLNTKVTYCDQLLRKADLPLVSGTESPIFFVGMGQTNVGYNMVKRILDDGFYVNIAIFPIVSVKNTGLRFTITRHQTLDKIEELVDCIKYHYPRVLEEEGKTQNQIRKAFNLSLQKEEQIIAPKVYKDLTIQHETGIEKIDKNVWDSMFATAGNFDWEGLRFLEDSFCGNPQPEFNWDFHYYIIRDSLGQIVLATHFTSTLIKDDMLSPAAVSRKLEQIRRTDPYYLTSKTFSMGSFFSEGDHLFLDRKHPQWEKAMKILLEAASKQQEACGASILLLRDFHSNDDQMKSFLIDQGFLKVNMPPTHIIEELNWTTNDEFLKSVSYNSRKYHRKYVLKHEDKYEVEIIRSTTESDIEYWDSLFQNVKYKKFEFNIFGYPGKAFRNMILHPNYEVLSLKLKPEFDSRPERRPVSVIMCYRNKENYIPILVGVDYNFLYSHECYRQALFQAIKRAKKLGCKKVHLGFTAPDEKRRFNAISIPKSSYIQVNDNFNMELIELIEH